MNPIFGFDGNRYNKTELIDTSVMRMIAVVDGVDTSQFSKMIKVG